jgi:hypothetical protein
MDECCSVSELSKKINVLDAITWIDKAWRDTAESTIQKCFKRCGFTETEIQDEDDDDLAESVLLKYMISHVVGPNSSVTESVRNRPGR